ncbi:class I SAM-dependent DNA methyltransferase [Streptomonospora nanhaiensis]|uniref:class I SAM-dependent DNA methyltransferase n=1 Tax=Streptomonospora nanhaiensis TaxID=1323731 RepID=UPI001C385F49|nr:class I SAM-dependent DNA methyltransferase [Streptomonospora nanhaiensis]MBV2366826.1 class I SAM-dependent DNA methyltransferase [Streptomonospora nanhaiensis]
MSTAFDSFTNRGEYFSAHYFAEQLDTDLKKGLFATWALREGDENDPRRTPRELLRTLRTPYLAEDMRSYFAKHSQADAEDEARLNTYNNPEWTKRLAEWHQMVLRALGYDTSPAELTVHRAGRDHILPVAYHGHGVIAIDCGWSADNDSALNADGAGRLLQPFHVSAGESYETGAALASWLFQSELGEAGGPHPRFILLLCGGVLVLADRHAWNEGRYLAVNLDTALERNDRTQQGELATIAALFSLDMLRPGENDTSRALDALLKSSSDNAAGVSGELRYGLQRSVEIIANEVLHRMAEPRNNVTPADIESPKIPFARELTREALRYLYRILFLLYAEARPELGILPADDGSYEAGYSMARLRELVARDEELVDEEAKNGLHLYESLDVLFNKVNFGHRPYGTEPDDEQPGDDEETRKAKAARRSEDRGLRFEPLRSELFEPTAIRLIGTGVLDPRCDEDNDPRWLDLRLRNEALHEVLRLLTMKKGRRGERGGFISYRNLGINQLGAVYEGLMSYTGIIAEEELCEVAKGGDPEKGSWLIPFHKQDQYPDATLVHYDEDDARKGLRGVKKYETGSFVYRLAGRDRETSASYYTPESLTKVTVELALKHRLDQERDENGNVIKTRASELLKYKICEPALGSGAFLNEAVNQVADEYLRRRQEELGITIPAADMVTEKQKVKAYVALHNAYGVDLNATGVELAEVSLWLNTMHPGMRAPWFGLHLRRGNSLIGARRAVFAGDDVASKDKAWLKAKGALAPTPLPFLKNGEPQPLPEDAIHQFLLPCPGWAAVAGAEEAKELAKTGVEQLATWKKGILQRPKRSTAHLNKDGTPKTNPKTRKPQKEARSQFTRLRDAARRVEFLWSIVIKRMELSEREIARRIDVWQADPTDPEYAFLQCPNQAVSKEKVLEDLFNAVDTPYWRLKTVMDAWCALWFWPIDKAELLNGTDAEYTAQEVIDSADVISEIGGVPLVGGKPTDEAHAEPLASQKGYEPTTLPRFIEATSTTLFSLDAEQISFDDLAELDEAERSAEPRESRPKFRKKSAPKPATAARRRIIPLKDLDDWLDFLESMLGTADLPEGTLLDSFESLDALKEFEENLPGFMGMDTANPEDRYPWLRVVRDTAREQGFLHWELEFALVFARGGGFDLQVGNPPWVRPKWKEDSVLAEYEPWFMLTKKPSASEKNRRRSAELTKPEVRDYVLDELTATATTADYLASPQVYPLIAGSQPDLYRAFMCQTWDHTAAGGTVGLVHPDTHFNGDKEATLREAAYRRLRVHGDFVNAGNRFFPPPVGRSSHFGVHIYGERGEIDFDHLSWLFSVDALRLSGTHEGSGDAPGVKYRGDWDERPHRQRVIRVTPHTLARWQKLSGEQDVPVEQARLLTPVSTVEDLAIDALAGYPLRLGSVDPRITRGFDESGAKKPAYGPNKDRPLIDYNKNQEGRKGYQADSWEEVILKGAQLGVANPLFKQPSQGVGEVRGLNHLEIPSDAVPESEYRRGVDDATYRGEQAKWLDYELLDEMRADPQALLFARSEIAFSCGRLPGEVSDTEVDRRLSAKATRPYTEFYRLAWRERIAADTERGLYVALIPPGATHVNSVRSAVLRDVGSTVLTAGYWAALPMDYLLQTTGVGHLDVAQARRLPAPTADHPLASALLLRTLRLNCLTAAYTNLWKKLYNPTWNDDEPWACKWPGMKTELHAVTPAWQRDTPLRTEYSRRAALVEIDALVAVWLGIDADTLITMYRARFDIMQGFDQVTWFDANERKIAGDRYTYGHGQEKKHFTQLQTYLADPKTAPVPDGYTSPFYKANRESEMREAHAYFRKRLDDAIANGKWDPVKQEVPKP